MIGRQAADAASGRRAKNAHAALRLRRTRFMMALAFSAATALALAILASVALQIDSSSRTGEIRSDVAQRAGGLARAVYFEGGELHLEPLAEDELARGGAVIGVLELSGGVAETTPVASFGPPALLPQDPATIVAAVRHAQGPVVAIDEGRDGDRIQVAAAPVWDDDEIGAVVIATRSTADAAAAHDLLLRGLLFGSLALLVLSSLVAYALAGRAMRPAAAALESQETFLAEAAHELRTPLSTLRLRAEQSGDAASLVQIDRLDRVLSALLVRARMSGGGLQLESVPLRLDQLVESTVDELAPGRRVSVTSEPVVVHGDPALLGQAVRNLVENALRHGEGSPVRVQVTDGVVVVEDAGPGIPVEERDRALRSGIGSGGGIGAGLAIVSWIVHEHGGSLVLGDAAGGGLRVELRLSSVT